MDRSFDCAACEGTGWVCEKCGTRWELPAGGTCCGSGKACLCNSDGEVQWDTITAYYTDRANSGQSPLAH